MTIPNWFGASTLELNEKELRERLEYEETRLELLQLDVQHTRLQLKKMKSND